MIHNPRQRIAKLRKAVDATDSMAVGESPLPAADWWKHSKQPSLKKARENVRWYMRNNGSRLPVWWGLYGGWSTEERALKRSLRIYRRVFTQ